MSITLEFPEPLYCFSRRAAVNLLSQHATRWLLRSGIMLRTPPLRCWGRGIFVFDGVALAGHPTPGVQQQYQEVIGFPLDPWKVPL